jgi:hypothetical protein
MTGTAIISTAIAAKRQTVPNRIAPQRRYPWDNQIDGSNADYLDSGDPYETGLTPVEYYDGSTRGAYRGAYYPSFRGPYIGIRCVRESTVLSIDESH